MASMINKLKTNGIRLSEKSRCVLMLVLFSLTLSCGGGESLADPIPSNGIATAPETRNDVLLEMLDLPDENQTIDWWMHERFETGFESYNNTIPNKYDPDYVYPDSWGVGFSVCEEFSAQNGRSFEWIVTSKDGDYLHQFTTTNCISNTEVRLPVLKEHTVQVKVLDNGIEQGAHLTVFTPRDLLIVSMGDSIASGESLNTFVDRQCHRSRISGHAKAAEQLEFDDPHSSVTFLFLACSGAKLEEGVIFPQKEFQTFNLNSLDEVDDLLDGEIVLRSEISQYQDLVEYLCDPRTSICTTQPRSIDKLFLTVGANDLGWSKYIRACATGKSLDDLEIEDILPIASLAHIKDVRWSDIRDKPLQQFGNALTAIFDAGLLFFDELFFDEIAGWFGIGNDNGYECRTASSTRAVSLGMSALKQNFAIVDAFSDGEGYALIRDILRGESFDYLERVDSAYKEFLVCTFGTDLQRLNAGYSCSSTVTENVTQATYKALEVGEVYLLQYPYDIFSDRDGNRGGCGLLGLVGEDDANWFYELGQNLDSFYRSYADFFRWSYVWRINDRYETDDGIHHGYCAGSDSWYEGKTAAFLNGNDSGTLHPNTTGHQVISEELLQVVARPKPSREEKYNVAVSFDNVTVTGPDDAVLDDRLTLRAHERLKRGGGVLFAQHEFPRNTAIDLSTEQSETAFTIAYDDQIVIKANTDYSVPLPNIPTCKVFSLAPDINCSPGDQVAIEPYRHSAIVKTFTVKSLVENEIVGCMKTSLGNAILGTNISHLCQYEQSDYIDGQPYRTTNVIFTIDITEGGAVLNCPPNCDALPFELR